MARKPIVNDQVELIEDIKDGKIAKVWEKVKHVGIKDIPDPMVRFLIFNKVVLSFNPDRNNNFIHFYKQYMNFHKTDEANMKQYKLTNNRNVINLLKTQACSPSDNVPELVRELMSFS